MPVEEPDAVWSLDFARGDGTGGFLRLSRVGDRCWAWAYLVGPSLGLVVVRDHDVAPPRRHEILDVRAEGLWMELLCETPGEHWTFGLEAFGVRLDEPGDALRGEIGERLPVGCDLEWEIDGVTERSGRDDQARRGELPGTVHGELLVGNARIELDASGVLREAVAPHTAWPTHWAGSCRLDQGRWARPAIVVSRPSREGLTVPVAWRDAGGAPAPVDVLATAPVPLVARPSAPGPVLVRVLAGLRPRDAGLRPGGDEGDHGTGWLEMLQSWGGE